MLDVAMKWLGFGLCHQLPERSLFAAGHQLPVCARDTGLYLGFMASLALIALLERGRRRSEMPPAWVAAIGFLLLAAMAWDGITSYAGLRETTNLLRMATGIGAGFALALVVAPILNAQLWRGGSTGRILAAPWEALLWVLSIPATFALAWWILPALGTGYVLLAAACILATFTCVNLVIVALVPRFERGADRLRDLVPAILIALAVTLVELALADVVRLALLRLVARG